MMYECIMYYVCMNYIIYFITIAYEASSESFHTFIKYILLMNLYDKKKSFILLNFILKMKRKQLMVCMLVKEA